MTKVISISDDAYNELVKIKLRKSFSELIMELSMKNKKNNLVKFAGILNDEEAGKIKREIYKDRNVGSRRFK